MRINGWDIAHRWILIFGFAGSSVTAGAYLEHGAYGKALSYSLFALYFCGLSLINELQKNKEEETEEKPKDLWVKQ